MDKQKLIRELETLIYALKKDNFKIIKIINMDLSNKIKKYHQEYVKEQQKGKLQ